MHAIKLRNGPVKRLLLIFAQIVIICINSTLSESIVKIKDSSLNFDEKNNDFIVTTPSPTSSFLKNTTKSNDVNQYTGTQSIVGEVLGTAAAYKLDIREPLIGCSISEFACSNGKCIPSSKYCDRVNDCDDSSDEPRFCTRCNRTYYGNLGMTNNLELTRPKEERLPFFCELNFTAAGGVHGDIVQITIDGFSVGKFCSYVMDGCPDGFLQISEATRASVGGMWCGSMDEGPVIFYSETRTVILTLKLLRNAQKGGGNHFDFRMSYKVLPRENAIVRFGGGVSESTKNSSSGSTSYYNKNIFRDNEPNEDDAWIMTTRIVGQNNSKNNNVSLHSSKRNKERKKDREKERDRDRDRDRVHDRGNKEREKDINPNRRIPQQNSHYEDFDYSGSTYYNVDYNDKNIDRNVDRNVDRSTIKQSKGFILNKPFGHWPFHSDKDINNYFGNKTEPKYYLGTLISGTHCSRIYSDCDKKTCRLQSPNYPGIYPRNLTCYYAIRQHDVPPGKHALITVRQPNGESMWIQTSPGANKKKADKQKDHPQLVTWDDCDIVQDFITIYDGYTTRDPVILKFCGGGGNGLASATSSGPELLIEFVTSPYGMLASSQVHSKTLNGFHLEISVEFVDTQSYLYAKNKQMCEFWIRGTGHGELESPRHSLSPNTTCLYHLQGTESIYRPYDQFHSPRRTGIIMPQLSRFKVWISVLKFNLSPKFSSYVEDVIEPDNIVPRTNNMVGGETTKKIAPNSRGGGAGYHYPNEECNGMLRIWDGPLREVPICNDLNCERDSKTAAKYGQNLTSVIARFCYNRIPKSCDHGILNESLSRPCTVLESYVSSSEYVTLELRNIESTVLQPVKFKLRYEFVDYQQDGSPIYSEHECQRKFVSSELERRDMGKFRSVKNIFLFGRGGARNLNCVYRFESERDERIRITIKKITTSTRQCLSRVDPDTKRSYCFGDQRAKLEIMEQPTGNEAFYQRGCACNSSNTSDLPIVYTSSSQALEVRFTAFNMTAHDDPEHLNFEATYEFIKLPLICQEVKKLSGVSGIINIADENKECRTRQWIIEPNEDRYLYVRMSGSYLRKHSPIKSHLISESGMKSSYTLHCPTRARFVFTSGDGLSVTACPINSNSDDNSFIEIMSSGWDNINELKDMRPIRSISIEYIDPDDQNYQFTWFEMVPRVSLGLIVENCEFICPELDACVNSSVLCDGINHCPSGYDFSGGNFYLEIQNICDIFANICEYLRHCRPNHIHINGENIVSYFCKNCEPARNTVPDAPDEWIGKVHHTLRKKMNVAPRPKQMTFNSQNQRKTIMWDPDNNASRNMIYKAMCVLKNVPFKTDFNKSAYTLKQEEAERQRRTRNMPRASHTVEYDESFTHCSALLKLPAEILASLCVSIILTFCIFSAYLYRKIKRSFRGSSILQTRLKSLSSMDTATFDDKDVIC